MDHLPRPEFVPYDSNKFDIRCYTNASSDGPNFDSYPERYGWGARSGQEWYEIIEQSSDSFQGFLQSWLYFGAISSFFRRPVDIKSFTKSSDMHDGNLYLDSSQLPRLLKEWLTDMDAFQNSDYMALSEYLAKARFVHEALRTASREEQASHSTMFVTLPEYLEGWPGGRDPRDPMMAEAQSALFDAIDGALARAKEIQGSSDEDGIHSLAQIQGRSSFEGGALWNLLRQDGWCPSELSMIFASFSLAGIYFVNHLDRPNKNQIHVTLPEENHDDRTAGQRSSQLLCSNRHCTMYQLDPALYKTQHTDTCAGCEDMKVENDGLLSILRSRKIPIVAAIGENWERTTIRLVEQSDEIPYLAISHVWADGLGNLVRNGIPRCQMLRLSKFAKSMLPSAENAYFWLDTVCCPPDSMGRPIEQNIALDLMRDTYSKAHTVLVLDKWLCTQRLCMAPTVDALFKVICSPWTRRLWTLQEGALAQILLISCSDGLFDPDSAVNTLLQQRDDTDLLNIRRDILHRWYTIRGFKDLQQLDLFHALYPSLAFRTTSVFEDEPLCLATLFGFQVSEIASSETHQGRMQKFWSMFKKLPAEILGHFEARMQVPGLRWAPRSFMYGDLSPYSHKVLRSGHWDPAARTDRGLEMTARGYYVHIRKLLLTGPIYLRHPAGFWAKCTLSFDLDAIEPIDVEDTSTNPVRTVVGFSPQQSHQSEEIALIYHSWGHLEEWLTGKRQASRVTGSVASILDVVDGRVAVRRFGMFGLAPISQTAPIITALEAVFTSTAAKGYDASDIVLKYEFTGSVLAAVLQPFPENQDWLLD